LIGLTSAPAGVLMLFDAKGAPLATHQRADISGLAALPSGLVATDGQGGIWNVSATGLTFLAEADTAWDNHLISLM
jgi:uncharacterized protein